MPASNEQIVVTTEEARQATGQKMNFRVLVKSMILTVAAFALVAYLVYMYGVQW